MQDTHYTPHQVYHFQIESDGLKIKQDNASNYLFKSGGDFIVRNGNVLLGQGTPLYKLHIKDPLGGAAIGLERGGKLWRLDLENNSDRLFIGHTEQSQLFTFRKNGNLGIGTINPSEKLEVNASSSTHAIFKGSFSGIQGIQVEREAGDKIKLVTNYLGYGGGLESSSKLRFSVNGSSLDSPAMIMTEMGNMGIGTESPDSKLTVKGNIHAEEVRVDLSVPGPDYVFKEGYNLKSLEEVQNYIKENGHLPNIPSAKEMEENGIELGEMNMKLLEKIEELTLYIIEQNRKIDELKNDNDKLQKLEQRIIYLEKK
ncbi:tail fiber protein [Flagellimonas hadalis]|uniref:BZIP transcription factor n=1 Tax=Flagellimonas hadalis TaxID=2597517 RepID=A0A5N5IZU0_9FLAO|nr:tail fiber protein [Allomuricauda hadalis]KAB5483122.1 hypothetical protein FOT42_017755 [Allomuricauda hadalis]